MHLSGRKYSSGTQHWTQRQRIVLLTLIGANVAVFVTQLFLDAFQAGFVRDYLGLSSNGVHDAYAWEFLTAMFLHNGAWHLIGNMLVLYLLGRDLESILGQRHFLYLYLAGAIGGELGHLFIMPPDSVLLAASGGVAAVLVAYATILPELELTAMMFFVFPIRLKAKHLARGAFVLAILLIWLDRGGTVVHSAYLGGCAAGWIYAHLLGFGRPSFVQRLLRQHRVEAERYEQMSIEQLMTQEIDPVLEKIARTGLVSLTRNERRSLGRARDQILRKGRQD
jgi:membrane associated rhomboid family serine protease